VIAFCGFGSARNSNLPYLLIPRFLTYPCAILNWALSFDLAYCTSYGSSYKSSSCGAYSPSRSPTTILIESIFGVIYVCTSISSYSPVMSLGIYFKSLVMNKSCTSYLTCCYYLSLMTSLFSCLSSSDYSGSFLNFFPTIGGAALCCE
jgi:hypothetical protein